MPEPASPAAATSASVSSRSAAAALAEVVGLSSSGTFIAHGDDDQIVPIGAAALKSADLVPDATLKVYPGAPHGIAGRYQEAFDADLLAFIQG